MMTKIFNFEIIHKHIGHRQTISVTVPAHILPFGIDYERARRIAESSFPDYYVRAAA